MKFRIIYPRWEKLEGQTTFNLPPHGPIVFAAALPGYVDVKLTDENVETAKRKFWNNVYDLVKARYILQPHSAVDKLTTFYYQAVQSERIKKVDTPDNLIWRTELKDLSKDIDKYRCYGGYFSEYKASSLKELSGIFSRKFQTLSYYGIEKEELIQFITQLKLMGIDRIVPIGKTTGFSLTHDGFNLIDTLSREIELL